MSKAFTNEDTPTPDDAELLPPRAVPLPITPAGLARLQSELAELTRGARVALEDSNGQPIAYEIVGPDEAVVAVGLPS